MSRQPMMCIRVDLPEPDGPMIATKSPCATSRSTPRRASTSTTPVEYVLRTPVIFSCGLIGLLRPARRGRRAVPLR